MRIDKSILDIIESGEVSDNLYFLPDITLDRKVYLEVNKVLIFLGGKWNRKLKAHVFTSPIGEIIDNFLLTGDIIDIKKEFQIFETPLELAEKLVNLASITSETLCLEPSAGGGNIVREIYKKVGKKNIICFEICEDLVNNLKKEGFNITQADFLNLGDIGTFDRIIMNPPFSKQQDVAHVLKALNYLKPNGLLLSIMSSGILFRTNLKTNKFWEEVKKYNYEIEELPKESFKSSGTKVNTILLTIRKE
jgi:type I restriction-modification system DNA methylase subunit